MAERTRVLSAYAGGERLFEVFRDPDAGWRLTGVDVKSGKVMDEPTAEASAAINWLEFHAQPQDLEDIGAPGRNDPVMQVPFIPGTAALRLAGATPERRSVRIGTGLIRCFLNGIGRTRGVNEVVSSSMVLALSRPDAKSFQRLEVRSALFDYGPWSIDVVPRGPLGRPIPIPLTRASLLKDFRYSTGTLFDSRFTLGPALGFHTSTLPTVQYLGRLFDNAEVPAWGSTAPLQWGFGITAQYAVTYDLAKLGFPETDPETTLTAPLDCRQRPHVPVGRWGDVPDWVIEARLRESADQILELYNDSVAEVVRRSVAAVRSGQPLSLLPNLDWDRSLSPASAWSIWFEILGEWDSVQTESPGGEVSRQLRWPQEFTGKGTSFRFQIGTLRPNEAVPANGLPVTAEFRSFRTEGGDPLRLPFVLLDLRALEPTQGGGLREDSWARDFGAALEIEMALQPARSKGPAQRVRLGAIQVAFAGSEREGTDLAIPAEEARPVLRFAFKGDPFGGQEPVVDQLSLTLGVFELRPGSQDPLPGEEYAELFQGTGLGQGEPEYERQFLPNAPLVLELGRPGPPPKADEAPFRAALVETVLSSQSQTVDLRLSRRAQSPGGSGAAHRFWVYDASPQLFTEVRFADFSAADLSDLTGEVAHFSTRSGAVWEVTAAAAGFDLVMPPQGLGDVTEKYRNAGHPDWPEDIEEGKVIAFRFTPPAVLAVQPAYYRQRFAEPPWNLRRLLGYAGERDPGMALTEARFELLYGLAGQVTRSDLRLAEIGARLGLLSGRQPQIPPWGASDSQLEVYERRRASWGKWYAVLRGRLGILEPWQYAQGDGDLRLTDGVSFRLRTSARLAFPARLLPDGSVLPPDPLWLRSLAPDVPAETYVEDLSELTEEDRDRIERQAPGGPLPGGVAWPFESLNLYNQLWKRPESDAGELSRPYFSMLGGWGHQKATFADGQLRIYSDTAMGRTHGVTLEVLGRISVTWHLAKLVIVYERSALPARQFFNEVDREQDALRGRPVLRKVKEYVEILEPFRAFPDDGSAPVERGCVLGVEFPGGARRINVTSRWGQDVGVPHSPPEQAEGWKVPLWVRGARPEDVYPQPQVVVVFQPAQGTAPVLAEVDDPEKLYFFTSTKDGRDPDPHRWPAVQGLDFAWCHPDATQPPKPPDAWRGGDLQTADAEPDFSVKGGLGPFTFALRPGSHPIDVMAERAPALGTLLRNVTLMRGYSRPIVDLAFLDKAKGLLQLRDDVQAGLAPAREWVGRTGEVLDLRDGDGDQVDELVRALGDRVKNIRDRAAELAQSMPDPAGLCPRLQAQVRRVLAPMRAAGRTLGDNFARQTISRVERVLQESGLPAARAALLQATRRINGDDGDVGEWGRLVNRFDSIGLAANELLGQALADVRAAGSAAFERLDDFSDALEEMPLAVTEAAVDWSDTARAFREARETLHDALASLDDALGQATRPWVGALPNGLRVAVAEHWESVEGRARELENVLADLESAFDELDQADYDRILEALPGLLHAASGRLQNDWKSLLDAVDAQTSQLLGKAKDVRDRLLQQFKSEWDPIKARLDRLAALASGDDLRAALRRELDSLGAGWDLTLQRVEDQAVTAAGTACSFLFGAADAYKDYLAALLGEDRVAQWVRDASAHMPSAEEVRRRFEALERELGDAARGLLERAAALAGAPLEQLSRPVMAAGDSVLRLVRAFGEAPRVPALDFRLPDFVPDGLTDRLAQIGYYFSELRGLDQFLPRPRVDITPVLAKANELGHDVLNALESALPTTQLFDRLIPFDLQHFDLRSIFPNFAGLNLADLFDGLKLPDYANQNVKVSHGADPQSLRGWAQIDVDVPFGDPITLFALAGLQVRVQGGRFQATSRIEAAANQSPRQTFRGSVGGDWEVSAGGFVLVVIERTALRFDDSGRITFDVRPDNVRLPGPMAWLADLISKFDFGDKGTSFKVTPDGVQVVLDLPLPDIQAGVFGMANLRLGFFFELSIVEGFVITSGANIARRDAPFTLTIFILGGAGWFEYHFRFVPASRDLVVGVSVGIMASASLSIALGPIKGGIYAYFGIVAEYEARQGAAGQLRVSLVIRFVGQVSVLGIISVYLELGLEAQYSTGGGLVGRGYVSLEIKICWCFTLHVRCAVTYEFGKSSGGGRAATLGYAAPAHARSLAAPRWDALDAPAAPSLPWQTGGWAVRDTTSVYDYFATQYVGMFE